MKVTKSQFQRAAPAGLIEIAQFHEYTISTANAMRISPQLSLFQMRQAREFHALRVNFTRESEWRKAQIFHGGCLREVRYPRIGVDLRLELLWLNHRPKFRAFGCVRSR